MSKYLKLETIVGSSNIKRNIGLVKMSKFKQNFKYYNHQLYDYMEYITLAGDAYKISSVINSPFTLPPCASNYIVI